MSPASFSIALLLVLALAAPPAAFGVEPRPHVKVRGIYGGEPVELMREGNSLEGSAVNAVWIGSGGLSVDAIERLKGQGARVFAEFNTMHDAAFLKEHPDAAPVGADGRVAPPPNGWQGVCPTHPGYRKARMAAFRKALTDFPIDGIWLDYHHAHASWEQAVPEMPDTCFCRRCLDQFSKEAGVELPNEPTERVSERLLGPLRKKWVDWRCGVFTDWVREFRDVRDAARPGALLGTFHCPWSIDDNDGALRDKLAIDLKAQAPYLDVLSPMPYHARFGHADDPAWVSRQTAWLGGFLGLTGAPGDRLKIWPIVQLSDWGESVPEGQVAEVLDHGTRLPSTGVLVFAWGSLRQSPEKVGAMVTTYKAIRP